MVVVCLSYYHAALSKVHSLLLEVEYYAVCMYVCMYVCIGFIL